MGCKSCKRKIENVVRVAQLMANFDNIVYVVYAINGSYNFAQKGNYTGKNVVKEVKPMGKEYKIIKIGKISVDIYKLDYEAYKRLTGGSIEQFKALGGRIKEKKIEPKPKIMSRKKKETDTKE